MIGGDKSASGAAAPGTWWLPLESNPDLITNYLQKLGIPGNQFQCADVFGVDPELLQMVPSGAVAVLLLYPISDASEEHRRKEQAELEDESLPREQVPTDVWFTKQTVHNACGTVGLLHAIYNNRQHFKFTEGSFFEKFYSKTEKQTPAERADSLSSDRSVSVAHEEAAAQGQSELPADIENINLHFNAFVCVQDRLIELDGRKSQPIVHGPTQHKTLLIDACRIVKQFLDRDPTNVRFSMIALIAHDTQ